VLEEEKCRVQTYQVAVKSLKELQEFTVQQNDSDLLGAISQAKVFLESQAVFHSTRAYSMDIFAFRLKLQWTI
jgi:hypothetical protein